MPWSGTFFASRTVRRWRLREAEELHSLSRSAEYTLGPRSLRKSAFGSITVVPSDEPHARGLNRRRNGLGGDERPPVVPTCPPGVRLRHLEVVVWVSWRT